MNGATPDRSFRFSACWGSRAAGPEQIARQWLRINERFASISPLLSTWFTRLGAEDLEPVGADIDRLAKRLENVKVPWYQEQMSRSGYYMAHSRNTDDIEWGSRYISMDFTIGSDRDHLINIVSLETDYQVRPDPEFTRYPVVRAITLAIGEIFDADYAKAYPSELIDRWPQRRNDFPNLNLAWLSYVAPRFIHMIDVPPEAIVEHRTAGGLLLSATTDQFNPGNADHMSAAQAIVDGAARFVRRIG